MNRFALFILPVLFALGCQTTPESAIYKVASTTAATVDASMRAWGDYVRAGLATEQDEAKVRSAYSAYQGAFAALRAAAIEMKGGATTDQSKLDVAMNAVTAASAVLADVVEQLIHDHD